MDREELERELETLHPASFAWALGCCGRDRDEAEEVLQDVYVKIFEGKARFDGYSTLKTWLFAVIRKTVASQRRRHWLRAHMLRERIRPPTESETTHQRVERAERTAALVRALNGLARRQREILELVFYHEMTIQHAAETVGISVGAARVHYQRGKKNLATHLQREGAP